MADTSVQITFVTAAGAGEEITVDLDADKHIQLYGSAKSQFYYGEQAYFRIFTIPSDLAYTVKSSDGSLFSGGQRSLSVVEEQIPFAGENEGNAAYPVNSITGVDWLGTSLGSVSAEGRVVTSSQKGVGILQMNYSALYRRGSLVLQTKYVSSGVPYDTYPVLVYIESVSVQGG